MGHQRATSTPCGRAFARKDWAILEPRFAHAIADAGATGIGQGLRANRALSFLDLTNNQIADEGARQLGLGLAGDGGGGGGGGGGLRSLLLGKNRVADGGAAGLAAGLARNGSLARLVLLENAVGDDGAVTADVCGQTVTVPVGTTVLAAGEVSIARSAASSVLPAAGHAPHGCTQF